MTCNIPVNLAREELIARAVRIPQHLNADCTRLRPAAFRPKAGTDDLSVMRKSYMGDDRCKDKAREILGCHYLGFAVLSVGEVRDVGAAVVDSRTGQFCGHAHISQGAAAPLAGEVIDPALQEKYHLLASAARLYIDPDRDSDRWTASAMR